MPASDSTPDTIVLIHGFWVTPRSWEHWVTHYEGKGYRVIAPAYPGFEVEVEALNADPSPIVDLTVPQILAHLENVVGELDSPPILMGHSAGGVFTQLLMDHGYGAAGVAINSAPPEGIPVVPLSQIKSTFAVLRSPANRHKAVGFTHEQWHYAFTNTFSEEESRALYERYHVPASGGIFWDNILANVKPGHQDTWRHQVVLAARDEQQRRAVVVLEVDPSVQKSNAKHYKSNTVTKIKQFEGRAHLMPAQEGWEEVADYALEWAVEHATQPTRA